MLKLCVSFNVDEAMFEDDRFCGYRPCKSVIKTFDGWYDVQKFLFSKSTSDLKYEVVFVEPVEE